MNRLQVWRQPPVVLGAVAIAAVAGYLAVSAWGGYIGFPLDDAWIHQTYARSLAWRGEFAFVPGQPSVGSTSPAWTLMLALGYALGLEYHAWTYALGAALLGLNAVLVYRLTLSLWPSAPTAAFVAGLMTAMEWHLVWAAVSGMETLLFSALALLVVLLRPGRAGLWLGMAAGLSVLVRPDGLLLLPIALARTVWQDQRRWQAALQVAGGFALFFVPYLLFNRWVGGSYWPNTYYAKQAEYAILREAPLGARLLRVGLQPFVGPQALLLPGLFAAAWYSWRDRKWEIWAVLGWIAAMIAAYALRLPVTYQHGRYLIPVIPAVLCVGIGGLAQILQLHTSRTAARVVSRAWAAAIIVLVVAFWGIGGWRYMRDVQIIESEMVATAHWVNQHTPADAVIAAHDIGALGYFGDRRLLDLAGLVSPDVIPFIRDEARLKTWLDERGADYLVTFPDWYPRLVGQLAVAPIFVPAAPYSVEDGSTHMAVYPWRQTFP